MQLTVSKTYTNWLTLLTDLVAKKIRLTSTQEDQLQSDASDWPSCACGQLCQALPRGTEGEPKDSVLYGLGVEFNDYISYGEYEDALDTFKAIEARSTKLLRDQDAAAKAAAAKAKVKRIADLPPAKSPIKRSAVSSSNTRQGRILPYNYDSRY